MLIYETQVFCVDYLVFFSVKTSFFAPNFNFICEAQTLID